MHLFAKATGFLALLRGRGNAKAPGQSLQRCSCSKGLGANSDGTGLRAAGAVKHTEDEQEEEINLREIK